MELESPMSKKAGQQPLLEFDEMKDLPEPRSGLSRSRHGSTNSELSTISQEDALRISDNLRTVRSEHLTRQAAVAANSAQGSKLAYVFNLGKYYFTEAELREVFDLFDHSNNGKITLGAVQAAMQLLGEDSSPESFSHWVLENEFLAEEESIDFAVFMEFIGSIQKQEATWEFRHTLTYWASITCLIGSLQFTLGSFFWLFDNSFNENTSLALITWPYLIGGTLFSVSAYIAYYECVNDQMPEDGQVWFTCDRQIAKKSGPLGSLNYFIGTLVFGVTCFAGPFKAVSKDRTHEETLNYGPSAFGCLFFIAGSMIECHHNKVLDWRAGIGTLVWWLCLLNLIGSVLFTVAAFLGLDYFDQSDSMMNRTVVWPYTIGSFMFAVASTIQIALWKRNLFGAGWMREAMEKPVSYTHLTLPTKRIV
eukprot:TRINITY_DN4403_c0_g1_i4.p1 TRINITY_DN4403_c0_g1~~TRINITY_DN4403_c0_g1_i4.p1  ORF type:complete len:421 (+),score=103.61 TRINITY_DN4403_c0_g1_i4:184-1446(+)